MIIHAIFLESLKKLRKELKIEKNRVFSLENEAKSLRNSLQSERCKYQRELLNFAEKIKNFKQIQRLYVSEKRNSEKIEKDLIFKENLLKDYQKRVE